MSMDRSRYLVTLICMGHFELCINIVEINSVVNLNHQVTETIKEP